MQNGPPEGSPARRNETLRERQTTAHDWNYCAALQVVSYKTIEWIILGSLPFIVCEAFFSINAILRQIVFDTLVAEPI